MNPARSRRPAPAESAVETTAPLGVRRRTYAVGDRVSSIITFGPNHHRRLTGSVTESSQWIFTITWDNNYGIARFTHGHEPESMRHATRADEVASRVGPERTAAARALSDVARAFPEWPDEVLRELRRRAHQLTVLPKGF